MDYLGFLTINNKQKINKRYTPHCVPSRNEIESDDKINNNHEQCFENRTDHQTGEDTSSRFDGRTNNNLIYILL